MMRSNLIRLTIIAFLFIPFHVRGGNVDHWESILSYGSTCRYLVPGSAVAPDWTSLSFNDVGWSLGPGGIGYGDGDDATVVEATMSVYCRYHFSLADPGVISSLILDVDFDDGFVAYLNGAEVSRYLMGETGTQPSWSQPSDGFHEAGLYQAILPNRTILDEAILGQLVAGDNVLAIEVHNENTGSSDLSSNVFLHAGVNTGTQQFGDTPYWFYPPFIEDSTLLPLMIIDTEGREIPNEPRITARMGLISNSQGGYNLPTDPFNEYDGQISIELRGESSLWLYFKKSYSIETQTDSGTNNNVSLLGLPEENDFVLYGPYGDKSLVRNVLSYRLYERFGHYSPRTRFIELQVNGDYQGLYVLTEKIKRDKNRVAIAKITPNDTTAVDISGGYILRIDKLSALDPSQYWESTVQPPIAGHNRVVYQYFDPESDELTVAQKNYIQGYLHQFEQTLVSGNFADPATGYRSYLDMPSFIDMMIFNEFNKDVDAFRLSHYFYKQKDTNGGRIVNGPPWDYNLTYGNSDFTENIHLTTEWTYDLPVAVYWWARVMQDSWFRNQLYCRWDDLYTSVLSPENVTQMLDSTFFEIEDASVRNFERWPILGAYVWPNSYVGQNYQQEKDFLRNWISDRLAWMDSKWSGVCYPSSTEAGQVIPTPSPVKVYPNPSDLSRTFITLNLSAASEISIRLYDMNGRIVFNGNAVYSGSEFAYSLPDLSYLPVGFYMLEVSDGIRVNEMCKLIKR